jgi:hypothetical protein
LKGDRERRRRKEDAMRAEAISAAVLAVVFLGSCSVVTTWAQEPAKPVTSVSDRPDRFLGLDIFAGGAQYERHDLPDGGDGSQAVSWGKFGWDTGATVSFGVRWVGITGTFGHHTIEDVPTYQVAVGPRVTSPWYIDEVGIRFFAHALVGVATTSGVTPSQRSTEWVIGGGFDVLLLRIQIDYVRLGLDGLRKENTRAFIGGVVPLCLRACRAGDGFNLSGRPPST